MLKIEELIEVGGIKFSKPNKMDKVLNKLFLWVFPSFVKPNHLTLFRYLTVPVVFYFVLHGNYLLGLIFFLIAAFSDALDGALARIRNLITHWGKLHDPLADKLLIGATGAVLVTRYIGFEVILIILLLELLTVISAIHLHDDKEKEIGARLPGKVKMVCQSIGIISLFVFALNPINFLIYFAQLLLYLAIIFSIFNVLIYKTL